jgi:hypothetical protein
MKKLCANLIFVVLASLTLQSCLALAALPLLGLAGKMTEKSSDNDREWMDLMRNSTKAGEPTRTNNPDGTLTVATVMHHKPTDQYWDHLVKYSAPDENSGPKIEGEWAVNWRDTADTEAPAQRPR